MLEFTTFSRMRTAQPLRSTSKGFILTTAGVVSLSLGRIHDILPHSPTAQRTAWSRATIAIAVFQVLGGYGYAFLFSHSKENYGLVFLCGTIALVMALIVDLFVREGGSTAADLSHPSTLLVSGKN
jgi:FtsH-binding integral membrane protein